MTGIPRQLTLIAAVLVCFLMLPAAALASGKTKQKHQPPATAIYVEKGASAGGPTTIGGAIGGESSGTGGTVSLPARSARKLQASSGKDSKIIRAIATNRAFGATEPLPKGTHAHRVSAPSAFGSAVDAGSGMRILFAVILGSVLLIGAAFVQRRRHR